jgi:hypothetical protein
MASEEPQPPPKRPRIDEPVVNIDSLPDAVLQVCFSFVGPGSYRFAGGTCRRFQEFYSSKFEKKTRWKESSASVTCAELCLEDAREEAADESKILDHIADEASERGRADILEWARSNGCEFKKAVHFRNAAKYNHLIVLQWADADNIKWFSVPLLRVIITYGRIDILGWIVEKGHDITLHATRFAAFFGQLHVLNWLKERDLLRANGDAWYSASWRGHINVLDWLYGEGLPQNNDVVLRGAAFGDQRLVFLWARAHHINCDRKACAWAAFHGKLPLLQWLRENDFSWDGNVLRYARRRRHGDVFTWARENECPVVADPLWPE